MPQLSLELGCNVKLKLHIDITLANAPKQNPGQFRSCTAFPKRRHIYDTSTSETWNKGGTGGFSWSSCGCDVYITRSRWRTDRLFHAANPAFETFAFLIPFIISLRRSSRTDRFARLYARCRSVFVSSARWCEALMARKREAYWASFDCK